jgi:hypothetical protein
MRLERERAVQALVPSPVALETLPQYSVAPAATVPREKRFLALMGACASRQGCPTQA